ncbi:ATP-binding protein [Gilvibacter sp.]|uniref:ATP-binding response regulator n=1 Tax=Gilvibacter sp. TaxID=2729997 RepID=UPI0025C394D7|nr:ATP-binding protein [Gilvibacter sp.]NQX77072.1 response regulator [Gilvibacter sp.]
MSLKSFKSDLLEKRVQIITTDMSGKVTASDDALIPLKKGSSLQDIDPFFEAIVPLVSAEAELLEFPCVNLKTDENEFVLDIELRYGDGELIAILYDFSEHYRRSHPVVQEKNENTILANQLLVEQTIANEKEALKNSFISKLSHELRKPLGNMMGFVNLLKDSNLNYDQAEMLKIVRQTGLHIEELLNDLLDISKISQGTLNLKSVSFKMKDVTKHLKDMFSLKAKTKRIEFEVNMHDNVPAVLIGDPIRVKQILINLVDNAFKNTPKGKVLLDISVDYSRAKKVSLRFSVSDTGYGIKDAELPKIFDSYYQIDQLLSPTEGQGLGLKIVDDLVKLQKGKTKVKSKVGEGTQFEVSLPFEVPLRAEKKPPRKKAIDVDERIRVLCVDDAELDQMLIMKILINEGFISMDLALHGEMALQLIDLKSYDVILLDLDLPILNGIEFLKRLRAERKTKKIPVVVLTAMAGAEYQKEAEALGISAYLTKPYQPKELVKAIKAAFKEKEK